MNNWKSSLLEKLNISAVKSSERGPGGNVKGMILAATVAVAFGAISNAAYAAEIKKAEPTGFHKVIKSIIHADDLILDPMRNMVLEGIVGEDAAANAIENANITNTSTGWHVANMTTTVIGVAAAAPVMGTWMLLKQADDTYEFIQDKQIENVNLKMAEVSERTQRIYDAEIQKMRDADPANQQMFAATGGDKPISDLEQANTSAAYADLKTSTSNLGALFPQDKAVEHNSRNELER